MSSKISRAARGPSWAEVIFGAVLAAILGVALGAALLIFRPVTESKEEPKERDPKTVYYIAGSKDTSKGREALAKKKAFVEGQSVTVTEDEINSLLAPADKAKTAATKTKDGKEAEKDAPAGGGYFSPGTPSVRIRDGALQVGVPITVDMIGQKVIAQAKGGFVKKGDVFVYEPTEMYLGSCPVQRLPVVAGMVRDKFLASQPIPEDVKAAWQKLANVSIEGNAVKLTMP